MPPQSNGVKTNQSIKKAFLIIETLVNNHGRMRLRELSQAVGMPDSSALRFLNALSDLGYVVRERDSATYRLTLGLAELGYRVQTTFSITPALHPYLEELRRSFGESASISIAEGASLIYVDTVEGPDHMLRTLHRIGKVAPMHGTGAGKAILSSRPQESIRRHIEEHGLPQLTERTITDGQTLLRELEQVRRQGYAVDDEECEVGVKCVAAPVRDFSGATVAAMSISAPSSRLGAERISAAITLLQDVVRRASAALGWRAGAAGAGEGAPQDYAQDTGRD